MTPATRNFDIYKGAKWGHTFTFLQSGTTDPFDLTGRGPFVFTVKKPNTDQTIFEATVTSDYDDTGAMSVEISSDQSDRLAIGSQVRYGLRDAQDNPYMVGVLNVKYFAPEPA